MRKVLCTRCRGRGSLPVERWTVDVGSDRSQDLFSLSFRSKHLAVNLINYRHLVHPDRRTYGKSAPEWLRVVHHQSPEVNGGCSKVTGCSGLMWDVQDARLAKSLGSDRKQSSLQKQLASSLHPPSRLITNDHGLNSMYTVCIWQACPEASTASALMERHGAAAELLQIFPGQKKTLQILENVA